MLAEKQIAALKYLIFHSRDVNDLSKRILAFLIDKSEQLTKGVCLTLIEDREGYTSEEIHGAADGVSAMQSSNHTTHLNALIDLAKSRLRFSYHYGDFDPNRIDDKFNNDGQFAGRDESRVSRPGLVRTGMPMRYTFWLAEEDYSRNATFLVTNRQELEEINLKKPGLYPLLEAAA